MIFRCKSGLRTLNYISELVPWSQCGGHCLSAVVTGEALREVTITNASCVVHFTPPSSQPEFGRRLWCMVDNFLQPFNDNSVSMTDCQGESLFMTSLLSSIKKYFIKKLFVP